MGFLLRELKGFDMPAQTETKHTPKVSHTPGPWKAESTQPNLIQVEAGNLIVADCWSDDYECAVSETDWANAHLIAAAPEMLAELCKLPCAECGHELIRHLDRYGCEYDRGDRQVQEVGSVAIGPCSCNGGEEDRKIIDVIRGAKGKL
jgi:hypothetical protein